MFVFIPKKLNVEGRPDLSDLPLNVLLNKSKQEGKLITYGTALYEPDFSTYTLSDTKKELVYKSIYDTRYSLVISLDLITGLYKCQKLCDDEEKGMAYGYNWQTFFVHVGILFLSDGEKCSLEYKLINS